MSIPGQLAVPSRVLPGVSGRGRRVQRPVSPQVSVVDVCPVLQQELAGQQRPLQVARGTTGRVTGSARCCHY